jgi:hypothetical protein
MEAFAHILRGSSEKRLAGVADGTHEGYGPLLPTAASGGWKDQASLDHRREGYVRE